MAPTSSKCPSMCLHTWEVMQLHHSITYTCYQGDVTKGQSCTYVRFLLTSCWLSLKDGLIWSFFGPVCFIIILNVFFFIITVWKLAQKFTSLNPDLSNLNKIKSVILCVCNFTWSRMCVRSCWCGVMWPKSMTLNKQTELMLYISWLNRASLRNERGCKSSVKGKMSGCNTSSLMTGVFVHNINMLLSSSQGVKNDNNNNKKSLYCDQNLTWTWFYRC